MNDIRAVGFAPVYNEESRLLILGSFPSVKSRAEGFYYGNPQNRFWRTVCSFFGDGVPKTIEEKREFLLRRGIALWDVIERCDIVGSADASIKNEVVADIPLLFENTKISAVFCNGTKSYELFSQKFPEFLPLATKLPSTSPANPRFRVETWHDALKSVFLHIDI